MPSIKIYFQKLFCNSIRHINYSQKSTIPATECIQNLHYYITIIVNTFMIQTIHTKLEHLTAAINNIQIFSVNDSFDVEHWTKIKGT